MSKERYQFIDMMRGLAMVVMVETHVVNSMMQASLRNEWWFPGLNFINGLVAPSFIFISGLAFHIASHRKIEDFRRFGPDFWRQIGRILLIWVTGYILQFPHIALSRILSINNPQDWRRLFSVNVLQCISAGLLLLLLVRILIRSDRTYRVFLWSATLVTNLVPLWLWRMDTTVPLGLPLGSYFSPAQGSLFPLFPWLGFMFAGAAIGDLYLAYRKSERETTLIRRLELTGLVVLPLCLAWMVYSRLLPPWCALKPDPLFFLLRLGYVVVILLGCWYASRRWDLASNLVVLAGRESLLVYSLHLQLIYQKLCWKKAFFHIVDHRLNLLECLALSAAMILLCLLAAWGWGRLKSQNRPLARKLTLGLLTFVLSVFFFLPESILEMMTIK